MAQQIADRRDVDFVLHEQLKIADLTRYEVFEEFNRKTVDLIVSEARNLAVKELLPCFKEGDELGCRFENGTVKVPEPYHRALEMLRDGEWTAMCDTPEWGGAGHACHRGPGSDPFFLLCQLPVHGAQPFDPRCRKAG